MEITIFINIINFLKNMNIIAFFTKGGIPEIGLSATIDIWKVDGSQVVTKFINYKLLI